MTTPRKLPWPVRVLALSIALVGLCAHVGLLSCVRRTPPDPILPATKSARIHVTPAAPAPPAATVQPAAPAPPAPAPTRPDNFFLSATKAGPVHIPLPKPQSQAQNQAPPAQNQAPAQRQAPRQAPAQR